MANITRVEFTTTSVYVYLSDNTFRPSLYVDAQTAFLYHATAQQRENWTFTHKDKAVHWPDLGETLLLDDKVGLKRYVAPVAAPEPVLETA